MSAFIGVIFKADILRTAGLGRKATFALQHNFQ